MLKPSPAQTEIVQFAENCNLIIDSVAGSGKTTTNIFIAYNYPAKSILLLTYNARLKLETRQKILDHGLKNIEVHSYHSFCVKYYLHTAYTDSGIKTILSNNMKPNKPFVYDMFIIDEAQDMTDMFFSLICKIWTDNKILRIPGSPQPTIIVSGDVNQCIFKFSGADNRYISMAETVFAEFNNNIPWKTSRLYTSYRCPTELTSFINKCVLKSDRMAGHKTIGHKPRYIVCDTFAYKTNRPLAEVKYYLSLGYGYEDIFILAPSTKAGTGTSPVRRLANALSAADVPIFVPVTDDDKLDEDVCSGKIVFASFHQVKGLERKVVIIFNFDNTYFDFYCKNTDASICPNTIYVALTRSLERITMLHHMTNAPFQFLDLNPKYIEYESKTSKIAINKPAQAHDLKISVTQLVSHLQDSVVARTMEFFKIDKVRNKANMIRLKTKSKQSAKMTESVAELNGLAIPAIYEYRTLGTMEMYKLVVETTDTEIDLASVPDLLKLANVWNSIKTGFIFKVKQITKYDWLTAEDIEECLKRMETLELSANKAITHYEYYLENTKSRELYGRKLEGYADYMDDTRLIEFKCVHELVPEHFIQLAIYMYLAKIENQSQMIMTHGHVSITNIKPGDIVLFCPDICDSSTMLTGTVISMVASDYIINDIAKPDKKYKLPVKQILLNLTWVKGQGLVKKYTYQLYNILTDELFNISADLTALRQMIDYLIYQKYFAEISRTDAEFIEATRQIKAKHLK